MTTMAADLPYRRSILMEPRRGADGLRLISQLFVTQKRAQRRGL